MTSLVFHSKRFHICTNRTNNFYIFFLVVMMVKPILKEFCQKTSIHGLSSIVEAKSSLIKRFAWFVIFVISISYAGIQLKDNVDSKLTLSIWWKIIKSSNISRKQLNIGSESDNNVIRSHKNMATPCLKWF